VKRWAFVPVYSGDNTIVFRSDPAGRAGYLTYHVG
jgi:hypothetical protein